MKSSFRAASLPLSLVFGMLIWAQDGPETALPETKQFSKKVLISGLAAPWEITWGPDNMLWVTERTGKKITRIDPVSGKGQVAITIDEVKAPGGQDGLLGMALHPGLLKGKGGDYVYAAYTYSDPARAAVPSIKDPASPYRHLYGKIVRLAYDKASGKLSQPVELMAGLPVGNDHVAGRLKFGPDQKLYFTIGDRGHNQLGNFCQPVESQRLPVKDEVAAKDYIAYVGKSIRLNLDGSIPNDNPVLNGVVSHVFTYGHRNPQGLDFAPDGTLYSSEHGPKTDDEVNILRAGGNYGWPNVAGFRDGKAFEYARWAEASTPCSQLNFSDLAIHPSVPRESESAFTKPMVDPIATLFSVPTGFNFQDPACKGVNFICWPTVGASSIEYYSANGSQGIPGWDRVLFVTALKRGSIYVVPLTTDGKAAAGKISRYFQSENRYRDTAVSPDGRTIYVATDPGGLGQSMSGGATRRMQDPGAVLAFTYVREGAPMPKQMSGVGATGAVNTAPMAVASASAPSFTAEQALAGKALYNASCAVCHGNTMTNGTFGPPLAGEYFKKQWAGRTAKSFYDRTRAMPPAAPGSLPGETYASVMAYILEFNGHKAGSAKLPADGGGLDKMGIK